MYLTFAEIYRTTFQELCEVKHNVDFQCRSLKMKKEMVGVSLPIFMDTAGVSVFSHPNHRVVPIRFALAELCYYLSGRNDVESIASYNVGMKKYSSDGVTMDGAYGYRLKEQLPMMLERLKADPYTRQACASIYNADDTLGNFAAIPCNVFIQILNRAPLMTFHVTARSIDAVTGLSIDALHWQFIFRMFAHELGGLPYMLYYDIASLHMYESDWETTGEWHVITDYYTGGNYEYFLKTDITLSQAIKNCKDAFKANLKLEELCELLHFDKHAIHISKMLDEMFKRYRNKLVR